MSKIINAIRVYAARPFYYLALFNGWLCLKIWGNATWLLDLEDIYPERDGYEG